MEVTEKWLGDIGGWQAMKAAREYVRTGQVANATRDGIIFKGDVGLGQRALRATLIAAGGMKTEAKCGCNDARRSLICSHAIAVALSIISPHLAPPAGTAKTEKQNELSFAAGQGSAAGPEPGPLRDSRTGQGPAQGQGTANRPSAPTKPARPDLREEDVPAGTYAVYVSTPHFTQITGSKTASVPIAIQFNPKPDAPRDLPVARWLHDHQLPLSQTTPQHLRLPAADLGTLLSALTDHPEVHATLPGGAGVSRPSGAKGSQSLTINQDKLIISSATRWILHSEIDKLRQHVVFQLSDAGHQLLQLGESLWLYDSDAPAIQAVPNVPEALLPMWRTLITGAPVRQPITWAANHLTALTDLFELPPGPDSAENIRLIPASPRFECRLDGSQRHLTAKVSLLHPHFDPANPPDVSSQETSEVRNINYPIQDQQNPLVFYTRNVAAEAAHQRLIQSTGFLQTNIHNTFEIKGEREVLHFLASDLPKLRQKFDLMEGDGFRNLTKSFEIIRPHIKIPRKPLAASQPSSTSELRTPPSGQDWLSLEIAYEASDGFHIPRQDVLRLIRSGKRDYQGRDGKRYLIDVDSCEELESTLQDVNTRFTGGNHVAVRSRQVDALEAFLPPGSPVLLDPVPFLEEGVIRSRLGRFGEMLRPYQLEGVRWLERHSRSGGGGLLADEMGLGKTVQTLALLKLILAGRAADPTLGPAVVICPTSLLGNWSDEAARFTPELKTHISHDSKRFAALKKLSEFDVIFTSYALIQRDLDYYKDIRFAAIVLDEASYIRNPDTESARAVRQLQAASRFSLTGTPVENSVKDLWSIFSFTLPGYLPIYDDFNERFVKPLAKAAAAEAGNAAPTVTPMRSRSGAGAAFGPSPSSSSSFSPPSSITGSDSDSGSTKSASAAIMERLRRRIRPHILRRTKREVAKDLPEKIEKVLWCELTAAQSTLYHRLLDEGREEIRTARLRSGQGGSRMTMFTVLLRLRQVCNDLSLLGVKVPQAQSAEIAKSKTTAQPSLGKAQRPPTLSSGKLPVYEELLQESIEGGHKTLIFSQFVGMLKLLKAHAEKQGIPHCYLDGSSTDRPAQVASFQTDPEKKLFFISLKAGGYGLNLTAADEVVLVDPWWNPAVEAQAIDRTHRIGQTQKVNAYRLIVKDSIEEKIRLLQKQKSALANDILGEENFASALTLDDFRFLLGEG